jgi:hypothetical protein
MSGFQPELVCGLEIILASPGKSVLRHTPQSS